MPDYECFPLWYRDGDIFYNLDPSELAIKESLRKLILQWGKEFDETLNSLSPKESAFKSHEEEIAFENKGLKIWRELIKEIGEDYDIEFFSITNNTLYKQISEYVPK